MDLEGQDADICGFARRVTSVLALVRPWAVAIQNLLQTESEFGTVMPLTISPADEACQAIVARINHASAPYAPLTPAATYGYVIPDLLEETATTRVDVIHVDEIQLDGPLDQIGPTSHTLFVYVRKSVADLEAATVAPLKLLERQLQEWLDPFVSSDFRVRVLECGSEEVTENPSKEQLQKMNLFLSLIALTVRVEPHA